MPGLRPTPPRPSGRLTSASGRSGPGRATGPEAPGRFPPGPLDLLAAVGLALVVGALYARALWPYWTTGLPYTHAARPGQEVVGRFPGDYLQLYYHLWLLADGLAGRTPLFSNPYEFAWDGPRGGWTTFFLPTSQLFVALAPMGSLLAYNAFVLLSFPLRAVGMALLARRLVGPGWPALTAGLVFALAPYRYAVLMGGQPAASAFDLVPLTL